MGSMAAGSLTTFALNRVANLQEQLGRVMVPVNAILEALGAEVTWDKTAKKVTAVLNDQTFVLQIGSSMATVNGETFDIDAPAIIQNSRTLVPVRFISEGLGLTVDWTQTDAQVSLTSK